MGRGGSAFAWLGAENGESACSAFARLLQSAWLSEQSPSFPLCTSAAASEHDGRTYDAAGECHQEPRRQVRARDAQLTSLQSTRRATAAAAAAGDSDGTVHSRNECSRGACVLVIGHNTRSVLCGLNRYALRQTMALHWSAAILLVSLRFHAVHC